MSARGRHRRYKPSTVSRTSLKVTASGAGIAIPLVGAQVAHAAPQDVWEKVAACESSGKWNINTGNGFYGGLQFKQSTWQAYGGTAYAARADLASKEQQTAVAEKVLAGQGPRAWPNCGPRAGLTRDAARPAAAQQAAAKKPAARQPAKPAQDDGDKAKKASKARAERLQKRTTYEVVSGDTLSSIAAEKQVGGGWQSLYERNRSTIGGDPDLIVPGQDLRLTGPAQKGAQPRQKQQRPQRERQQKQTRTQAKPEPASATAPVSGAKPSTGYRATGANWSSGYHTGVDFPVRTGTTVQAVTRGKVVSAGWGGAYGYQVVLRHSDGKYSQYAHLSAISVRTGQSVDTGQRLGRSGATGNVTGPHLHFEVRTGPGYGTDINPLAYLRGRGVQV
ncbi:transglycosylase family protein [Streptomyces boncukensis]|uniref:Peptidoglycan DD-metalloendopeptidase family protein n=1 Tax=Streptomyces boncukensis TaxID=2711219 RepID=A0A6G4WSZ1_9ACTN|nr:transglycosylase family protein [Streptomyces boncukensis]NGO67747.1 peptidoglycan DD-metalloendopeptidase family protein [Streptomyces boncukensis]